MDDPRKLSDEKITYLSAWLNDAKTITDAVPIVQKQLDSAKWESSALSDAPGDVLRSASTGLCSSLRQDIGIIKRALPIQPKIHLKILNASSASTAATTMGVYILADKARQSKIAPIQEWGNRHTNEYFSLQDQLKREEDVLKLLDKLRPGLGTEFQQAANDIRMFLSGMGNQTSTGISMRNILEHYKGEIIELARKHPKEQKLQWDLIADRLVKNDIERNRFKQQEGVWNSLQQRLSKLAKGHLSIDIFEMKSTFAELIDHIYITLTLIGLA